MISLDKINQAIDKVSRRPAIASRIIIEILTVITEIMRLDPQLMQHAQVLD